MSYVLCLMANNSNWGNPSNSRLKRSTNKILLARSKIVLLFIKHQQSLGLECNHNHTDMKIYQSGISCAYDFQIKPSSKTRTDVKSISLAWRGFLSGSDVWHGIAHLIPFDCQSKNRLPISRTAKHFWNNYWTNKSKNISIAHLNTHLIGHVE